LDVRGPYEKRIVQIVLKTALQRLGMRTRSPSSFRFTAEGGRDIAGMHEIALKHELHSAHPAFHLRYPGKMRHRKKGEKALLSRFVHLHFPAHANVEAIVRRLRELPEVVHAAEYRGFSAPSGGAVGLAAPVFPADPLLGTTDQPETDPATGHDYQWYIFRCKVDGAWTRASGSGVVIADVDWGFFLHHEDLTNRVERTYNAWDGTPNVSAGATDHGTGVLGLAGAASNTMGIAGVAFGATLWAIQYNTGTAPQIPGNALASAIDWVAQQDSGNRPVVINVEAQSDPGLGNCEQDPVVAAAIRNAISKGCVVCVAAGNGGRDAGVADDGTEIPTTGSILVGATAFDPLNPGDNPRATAAGKASNYGDRIVVSAPGDALHDITCRNLTPSDYTNRFGGTSGAAAKVAGAIALMLEANSSLTNDDVKTILTTTGSQLNDAPLMGVFLNADAAVTAAIQARTS
jgi:hypothetical protein